MTKKWSSFGHDGTIMNEWKDYLAGNPSKGWYHLLKEEYENILIEDGEGHLLNEGVWEKIKYFASKAGSLEKGGKIIGGRKLRKQEREKLQAAMESASSKVIKDLDRSLRDTYPNFPNMERQEDWVRALINIGAIYDSLVLAEEKFDPENPTAEGGMDCQSANTLIELLRKYTRHQLDYELADIYKHFKENADRNGDVLSEQPRGTLKHGADDAQDFMARSKRGGKDVAYTKRGQMAGREETDSTTWAGLKSNLLPALLAAGGAISVASGILFNSDWFQSFFQKAGSAPEFAKEWEKVGQTVKDPGSVTERMGFLNSGDLTEFGPDATLGDLNSAIQSNGGIENIASMGAEGPESFMEAWSAALTGPNGAAIPANTPLQNVFGMTQPGLNPDLMSAAGGPGQHPALQLQIPRQIFSYVSKTVLKKAAVTGGQTAAGAAFASAGNVLLPLGIALLTSAAAVKLIRIKGMKSSRAQMLKDLLQEMIDLDCGTGPDPEDCDEVIQELMSKFKSGMTVRYLVEHGQFNITSEMNKGAPLTPGNDGETLITKITEMPGEGRIPSIEEQKEGELWQNEKVILIGVKGMIPLEAGDRKAVSNVFRAAGIRDCKLNVAVPTEDDVAEAYRSHPAASERFGLEKPEDGPAGFEQGKRQKQVVYLSDVFKALDGKIPRADIRQALNITRRLATDVGNPQKFMMKRREEDIRDYLEEAEQEEISPKLYIPALKLMLKLSKDPETRKVFKLGTAEGMQNIQEFLRALLKAGVLLEFGGKRMTIPDLKKLMKKYGPKKSRKTKASGAKGSAAAGGGSGGGAQNRSYFDVNESKRKRPCKNCKKKKLVESKTKDPWDDIKKRMKELSGIK